MDNQWLYDNMLKNAIPRRELKTLPPPVNINPKQYYDELYKDWGGLEGLQKLRAMNQVDPIIRAEDFDTPYFRDAKKQMKENYGVNFESIFPRYSPMDMMKTDVSLQYKNPTEKDFAGTFYDKNIVMNPYYGHKWDSDNGTFVPLPDAYNTLRHELGHSYQPLQVLRGENKEAQKKAYGAMEYNASPYEIGARMSAIMGKFVETNKTPVYNNKTANDFLDYMKKMNTEEYDFMKDTLEMNDDQIKDLSKKIVSNDKPRDVWAT